MTNTKRKSLIAMFFVALALALIALLSSSLIPLTHTVHADDATHTHNVCGEASCTHDDDAHTQAVEYAPLDTATFKSLSKTTLDSAPGVASSDFYVIPAGNYYLTEDINVTAEVYYLLVEQGVTLCLNGYTLKTHYMYVQNGTVNVCDCSADKTGVYAPSSGNYGIEIGGRDAEAKAPTFNLYSGTLSGSNIIRHNNGTLNIYGGKLNATGTAITIYGGTTTNVCDGEVYTSGSNAITFSARADREMALNIYDGILTANSSTVSAVIARTAVVTNSLMNININGGAFYSDTSGFNIYAHSLASPTNVINLNVNGGTWFVKDTSNTHYYAFYLAGWVNATVTKMTASFTDYGVFYIDQLANLTIAPEKDEDVQLTTKNNSTILSSIALSTTADMLNAEGNPVTSADYGKMIIKGGTFIGDGSNILSKQPKSSKTEISGGIFTTTSSGYYILNQAADSEILVTGGTFTCSASAKGRIYNNGGILRIEGAPTFENNVIYLPKILDENGAYTLDLSDYTGEQKLNVSVYTSTLSPSQDLIFAKGTTEQMVYDNDEWELVDTVDEKENAVVKLNHLAHTGGEPTCTVAATCEICAQQYTLSHTYGEMHDEIAATCVATGTKAHQTCSVCNLNYDANDVLLDDLTLSVNPNAHDLETHSAKAATCTEKGWTAYETCKREGCEHSTYQEIAALGHDFKATNNEEEHWKACSRCDETKDKTAHSFTDDVCECGYENPSKGLSTGAIIAIVIGCTVVVGIGGFAIVWFVIKKKSWADLTAGFKK